VVISLGGGAVVATDWPHSGVIGVTTIDARERQINRPYLGWTGDILGVPLSYPTTAGGSVRKEDDMSEKAEKQIQAIHDAIFRGGNSMPDNKKSIGQSLAEIQEKVGPIFRTGGPVSLRQEIADTKTQVYALEAAITALATANGADPAAILTAVERGVKDAMRDVSFVADVTGIK